MVEKELTPGDINNYAYGYQDVTGYGSDRTKKTEPVMPDDEGYMSGWFSGKLAVSEDDYFKAKGLLSQQKLERRRVLLHEWNVWRKAHGLEEASTLPL